MPKNYHNGIDDQVMDTMVIIPKDKKYIDQRAEWNDTMALYALTITGCQLMSKGFNPDDLGPENK